MNQSVRAIIIKDGRLLVMHRNKAGREYDALPGGAIEPGETPEEALRREVAEETQITFSQPRLVILEHMSEPYGDQHVYLCDYVGGEPRLHPESIETKLNQQGQNLYRPEWVNLSELPGRPLLSAKLKAKILEFYPDKWPQKTLEIGP